MPLARYQSRRWQTSLRSQPSQGSSASARSGMFGSVVDEKPINPREWLAIADEHVKQGDTSAAIEAYRKVAAFYREQDFPLKAYALCKQMLVVDPTREDIRAEQLELAKHLGIDPER
jgi:hypothetical protein